MFSVCLIALNLTFMCLTAIYNLVLFLSHIGVKPFADPVENRLEMISLILLLFISILLNVHFVCVFIFVFGLYLTRTVCEQADPLPFSLGVEIIVSLGVLVPVLAGLCWYMWTALDKAHGVGRSMARSIRMSLGGRPEDDDVELQKASMSSNPLALSVTAIQVSEKTGNGNGSSNGHTNGKSSPESPSPAASPASLLPPRPPATAPDHDPETEAALSTGPATFAQLPPAGEA